jgi:hypothetical protein
MSENNLLTLIKYLRSAFVMDALGITSQSYPVLRLLGVGGTISTALSGSGALGAFLRF